MRLVGDPEAAAWVEGVKGRPEEFDWDRGNRMKNRKHGVVTGDVEALLQGPVVFAGRIIEPAHPEPRWLLLGQDARGRRLAMVFTRRGSRLRPISCRPMRRGEGRLYEEKVSQEGPADR